jgi:hypothetical protein
MQERAAALVLPAIQARAVVVVSRTRLELLDLLQAVEAEAEAVESIQIRLVVEAEELAC